MIYEKIIIIIIKLYSISPLEGPAPHGRRVMVAGASVTDGSVSRVGKHRAMNTCTLLTFSYLSSTQLISGEVPISINLITNLLACACPAACL